MTAKEKLLERVMAFSEAEADEALRLLDAGPGRVRGRVGQPVEGARGRLLWSMWLLTESERTANQER